ncbi:MAG: ScpA/B protein [Candidatus Kaiserbacteria bacterium GW2011_GWA2_58_9]|uniref:Segregation and condensation protein A n=1 Tax=Candidatus Kaiserbacteria bacterium GW2011_GWA2_58_9 TaxID=1618672 RepID=A0A0G1YWD3_9BACT|nr:MAG: ScpA/B protein [Candidatus Kaiserbacteria bacterium GW2011_GWA2_58_9]
MERFSVETEAFSGPLEALLNLIEDRKLAISEVSLAEVTDAYLAYVEKLPGLPLGETAQFILVASTLLLIKSRTLLPTLTLSDDERESVQELERRLARYALIRKAARALRREWGREPLILVAPVLALEDVIRSLKARLSSAFKARFSELTRARDKHETIVYFLATLELVRSGSLSATQDKLFADIFLEAEHAGVPRFG